MRRLFKFLLLFLIAFTMTSFSVYAADGPRLVIVNPGEDSSTEMNISYHTTVENTVIQYSKVPNGEVKLAMPECKVTPFTETEKQCYATLTGLEPNSTYKYNILGFSTIVDRTFKTAGGEEFTFAHLTDMHSYKTGAANTRVATANKVLNKLNEIKELDFILFSGDMTAYGTVYEQWEALYGMETLKSNMLATTPGNHDYYNTSAQVTSIEYYNTVTNNPKNGAAGVLNSTYFFKYGNALFISLNSEEAANSAANRASQIKWLNEVTANNPSDFIIVFTHRPFYTGDGLNASQANDMRSYFQEIFDKTGVDLVLAGHNHVYARTNHVYENQKVTESNSNYPHQGTVYITGIQIGDRFKADPFTKPAIVDFAHSGANQDGGNLITIDEDKISIKFIRSDGTVLDTYEIQNKSKIINNDTTKSLFNGIKQDDTIFINYHFENGSTLVPGSIKKLNIYNEKNTLLKSFLNPPLDKVELGEGPKLARYNLKVEAFLRNGNVIEKDITVIDSRYDFGTISNFDFEEEDFQTRLTWKAEIKDASKFERYEIYVNGNKLKDVEKDQTSTILDFVSPYKVNEISFRVIGKENTVIYQEDFTYGEKSPELYLVFNYETLKLTEGDEKTLEYTVFPEQELKLEFQSSDPTIATVDENGKVKALKAGTVTITVNVAKRWDVSAELTITIEAAPEEPKPETPEKKGCFNSASVVYTGLAALGLFIIIRKRKYQ